MPTKKSAKKPTKKTAKKPGWVVVNRRLPPLRPGDVIAAGDIAPDAADELVEAGVLEREAR